MKRISNLKNTFFKPFPIIKITFFIKYIIYEYKYFIYFGNILDLYLQKLEFIITSK